ncbi:MAG: DUF3159 domain-containing protein [Marmoricola sp.]
MSPDATVEEVVRHQLAKALGGVRGMLEAAVPTISFTIAFLTTNRLWLAVGLSVAAATVLLIVRLVQHTSVQYVMNAFVGIAIGAFFAWRAAQAGGDATSQALAYFLPGILINSAYAVLMILSILLRHPVVGYIVGSVAHHPTEWRQDPALVKLCSRLTWVMAMPMVLRASVLGALYLAGKSGAMPSSTAIASLGVAKLALGWPLVVAGLLVMIWLLTRDKTPVTAQTHVLED